MRIKVHLLLLIFLLLLSGVELQAQQTPSEQSLVSIIKELQTKYDVQFNYASQSIENISITPPEETMGLEGVIIYLGDKTGLKFSRLSNTIITITKGDDIYCGYLKDIDSAEPVAFATIVAGTNTTISNEEGYFELKNIPEDTNIQIKHVGFKLLERDLLYFSKEGCREIFMLPDQQQ